MRKTLFNSLAAVMAIALILGLTGCGGGGAEMKSEISTTTTGQQLMDLKKALDSGALSKEEYDKEREKILEK
jgi:hypothetical protein